MNKIGKKTTRNDDKDKGNKELRCNVLYSKMNQVAMHACERDKQH